MTDFRDALMAAGLRPRDVPADGEWHRCSTDDKPKKKNGAFKLALDGRAGWFIDFASGMGVVTWHATGLTSHAPMDQSAIIARRARERSDRIQALRRVRAYWQQSRPCTRLHPYLERKGLSAMGTVGLREHDGLLVVPVWWHDKLISVQTIHPDGTKRFFAGCSVKGGAFLMSRKGSAVTALVEGLATGLAVFQAVRHSSVVVAFDCGNLLPVTQTLGLRGSVVFAADNDWGTLAKRGVNPGIQAATNAAELIGAGVAWPKDIEGTDMCDYLQEHGGGAHRKLERMIYSAAKYVG
jgi:putative DNA primase/helicase